MKQGCFLFLGLVFALLQFSCSPEEEVYELNTLPMEVLTRDSFALEVVPATTGWTFSSKNEHIASVSSSGIVTTHVMGTTTLYARYAKSGFVDSVQITVKPRTTYFQEPYLVFFVPQQTISDVEEQDYYAAGWGESWTCTYYAREYGIGYPMDLVYYFNTNDEYTFSTLCFNKQFAKDVMDHVSDRYIFMREKSDGNRLYSYYINPDSSTILASYSMQNELWLLYYPYSVRAMESIQNDTLGVVFER